MKYPFLLSAIAISLSSHAMANEVVSQHIVQSTTLSVIQSTPGYTDHEPLAGGKHLRVKVDTASEADAINYWRNAGLLTQKDSKLTRPFIASSQSFYSGQIGTSNTPLFNDTLFSSQDALNNPNTGYAQAMAGFRERKRAPRIAVLDTGAEPHEDFSIKRGYSFTTLFGQSEGDDYRPLNSENGANCIGVHGDQMLGIIGAKQNNNRGIAGLVDSEIYVGRVMSTSCNPTDPVDRGDVGLISDLYNGILWASNNYQDAPIGEPVDVINISLAAEIPCPLVLQEAIDGANAQGITVVVSSGNNAATTSRFTPANCEGVVVVGSHDASLNTSSFSNGGDHVSFLAHDTYLTTETDYGNNKASIYTNVTGTSGAAAAVSGFAGLIKGHFPDATPAEIKSILIEAAGCTGLSTCDQPLDANALPQIAESVLDPKISFQHMFAGSSCRDEKQKTGLSPVIDVCGAYRVDVKSELASLGNSYTVRVLRKSKNLSYVDWDDQTGKVTILGSYTVNDNDASIGLKNVELDNFDYAAVACYEDFCPSPVVLDAGQSNTPDACR